MAKFYERNIGHARFAGKQITYYAELTADTAADIPNPADHPEWEIGSELVVLENGGSKYRLSNSREWVKVNFNVGGGGGDVTQLTPEFAESVEWLEENGDTTKLYVLPDGYIYAYVLTEVLEGGYDNQAIPDADNTTDNTKWANGYRISSSGISTESGTTLSNSIYCALGEKVRVKGVNFRSGKDRYGCFNSDGIAFVSGIGYVSAGSTAFVKVEQEADGVYVFTPIKEGETVKQSYMRFAFETPTSPEDVIITVEQPIVEPTITRTYAWASTNHAFVPADYEDRVVVLEKDTEEAKKNISILKTDVSALEIKVENIGTTNIPEYWKGHIEAKIKTIKDLHKQYGKDCFSFILLADTHYPSNLGKASPVLAKKIMDETNIKYAIHVGDWQTRGCHNTKEQLIAENEAIDVWIAPIRDRLLVQQGNHDGSYGLLDRDSDGTYNNSGKVPAERETYVYNLTPQELYDFAYRKVGMIGNVRFDNTGTAYYIDDTANNVRYIGLNTQQNNYELQADGTQKYPKMWIMRFTQPQFDFLINEALVENTSNKTKFVIFGHVPTTQEIGDRDVMNGVLNAFVNKTTYRGNYNGMYGYDAVSVNVDFRNAKGTLVGYFHGHTHVDSVNTSYGFNLIGTRCDAAEENDSSLKAERVARTITEQSFDVFTITPDQIYATKIGAGSDRQIKH